MSMISIFNPESINDSSMSLLHWHSQPEPRTFFYWVRPVLAKHTWLLGLPCKHSNPVWEFTT